MRLRPIVVFATIAAVMVGWLVVRMWCGGSPAVWATSCVFGAWAPILAAMVFAYIRAVGDREDSVAVAWLVRAIGMHFLLVWMLGTSDWLRHVSAWNSDLGAPLVLLMFAPAFAVGAGVLHWLSSVARRASGTVLGPVMPGEALGGAVPFRHALRLHPFCWPRERALSRTACIPCPCGCLGFARVYLHC